MRSALHLFGSSLTLLGLVAACGPASAPPDAPVDVVAPEPAAPATEVANAATAPAPALTETREPAPPPPPVEPFVELETAPGDPRLMAGAALLKSGQPLRSRAALVKATAEVDADGALDAKMAGHALLGRACQALRDTDCTSAQFQQVRALWQDPKAAMEALNTAATDDKDRRTRAQRALSALGEALFFAAEEKRALADAERFPVYRGSGSKDDVLKHVNTKVAAWIRARRAKVEEAEKAYAAVLSIAPFPPPHWVIASAARVGDMWGKTHADFRASPIPSAWKQSGPVAGFPEMTYEELRGQYYEALDDASAPMKATAKAAYTQCWELAKKLGSDEELAKHCEAWLAKNSPPFAP